MHFLLNRLAFVVLFFALADPDFKLHSAPLEINRKRNTGKPLFGYEACELADFLACVEERRTPAANVEASGVALAKVMEAFYRSAREGKTISIS